MKNPSFGTINSEQEKGRKSESIEQWNKVEMKNC